MLKIWCTWVAIALLMLTQQSIYRFQTVSICFCWWWWWWWWCWWWWRFLSFYFTYFHIIFHMFVSNLYFIQLQPKLWQIFGEPTLRSKWSLPVFGERNMLTFTFLLCQEFGTPKVALAFNLTPVVGLPIESDNQPSACEGRGLHIYIYNESISAETLIFNRSLWNVYPQRRFRITAVFLKATLDAAADDAEHLMTERLVKKASENFWRGSLLVIFDPTKRIQKRLLSRVDVPYRYNIWLYMYIYIYIYIHISIKEDTDTINA